MATTPGQKFVRRQDAARTSTSNTTAADITYDTPVVSEGGYSFASPEVTVDEAGLYLNIFDLGQVDQAVTRAVGTLVPSVNTVNQVPFLATHRYLRNSSGAQEGASIGMAILDLNANDDVKVRNPGSALAPTPDASGTFATNAGEGGALQMLRLPAGNFTDVRRTVDQTGIAGSVINTTRPWLDSSGTWTTITFNSEVRDDDALYPGTGGDLTLKANTKYMIVWGTTIYSASGSRHTNVTRLQINGNNVQTGTGYHRQSSTQGPPMCGMYLHETGGTTETCRLQATSEAETTDPSSICSDAYLQVIELPASAEWIHADNGATDSMTTDFNNTTAWFDTPLSSTFRADGGSNLSLDGANNAIQNDSGGSLGVLAIGWHRFDRDTLGNGARKNPWTRWNNGGSSIGYGVAGSYSRGSQSTTDTWQAHHCSAALMDMAAAADLIFQAADEGNAANADLGIYASTNRHFLGVQVLDLATLDAGAGGQSIAITVATETETAQALTVVPLSPFRLTDSTNIVAGGANTTAQLTAPAGKTTANFTTGRIQDDENPADAIDIASGNYTEIEWNIEATDAAELAAYSFRITVGGTVLDTYTVTPQWTVTAGGGTNVVLGLSSETDLAQAITAVPGELAIALSLAVETDISQVLTVQLALNQTITFASEADLAQILTVQFGNLNVPINLAPETDLSQTVTPVMGNLDVVLAFASETEIAQVLALSQATNVVLGQAQETDLSQLLVTVFGEIQIPLTFAGETDNAQAVQQQLALAVNLALASELDTSQVLALQQVLAQAIALASETDVALALQQQLALVVQANLAAETDTSQTLAVDLSRVCTIRRYLCAGRTCGRSRFSYRACARTRRTSD